MQAFLRCPLRSTGDQQGAKHRAESGSRRKKVVTTLIVGISMAILGLWLAINRVPSVGPW